MRRPIDAGKRWIAGFAQHTATKSSWPIAAIFGRIEMAETGPQGGRTDERPFHRHLLVEQHADQCSRAIGVEQPVGVCVAGDEHGSGHVPTLVSPRAIDDRGGQAMRAARPGRCALIAGCSRS